MIFKPSTGSASGDRGIRAVAHKMHQEILDIEHYPEIAFTPTGLQPGDPCSLLFPLRLTLHGDTLLPKKYRQPAYG